MKIRHARGTNSLTRTPTERSRTLNLLGVRRPVASTSRQGVVLIVVLVLVMMVALAGFGFLSAMSTEYEASRLNGSMRQARQTLASAESTVLWFGGLSNREQKIMGGLHHNPALFRGHAIDPLNAPGSGTSSPAISTSPLVQQATASAPDDNRWRFSVVSLDLTQHQTRVVRFGLQNESSKLNLSSLMRWEQTFPGQGRTSLMQLPGMTEAIADSILDWIDADDQTREFGAETEYYQTLDRPYRAANSLPKQLTELLYVKGVTRQLLMGSPSISPDVDTKSPQSPSSSINSNRDLSSLSEISQDGWLSLLTLHSAEKNRNRIGQPKISLNAANLTELEAQLTPVLPASLVRYLLLARLHGLTLSIETKAGIEPLAAPFVASSSPAFRINSLADVIDSVVTVTSPSGPLLVQSPLQSQNPEFATQATDLMDLTTIHIDAVIAGRINLQTASESVLGTIPGLTPEIAAQIVTQRATLDPAEADSLFWLLSRGVMDLTAFRRVFPELTSGGDVFQGEIIVHRAIGGPMLRRNLIVDAASSPPRRVHWVDLTDQQIMFSPDFLLPPGTSISP